MENIHYWRFLAWMYIILSFPFVTDPHCYTDVHGIKSFTTELPRRWAVDMGDSLPSRLSNWILIPSFLYSPHLHASKRSTFQLEWWEQAMQTEDERTQRNVWECKTEFYERYLNGKQSANAELKGIANANAKLTEERKVKAIWWL